MKLAACISCDSRNCEEKTYSAEVDGRLVKGLKHFVCDNCDAEFEDAAQTRFNLNAVQRALGEATQTVMPEQIREMRARAKLTQRTAAKIFGGGLNAFSKYETGEILQSEAMDNLLWLAINVPGVICSLAARNQIDLSDDSKAACGAVYNVYSTFEVKHEVSQPCTIVKGHFSKLGDANERKLTIKGPANEDSFPSNNTVLVGCGI
jgi:putative zinc finger/helix-turn-helix YgiT family protein